MDEVELSRRQPVHGFGSERPLVLDNCIRDEVKETYSSEVGHHLSEGKRQQIIADVYMQVDQLDCDDVLLNDDAESTEDRHEHANDCDPAENREEYSKGSDTL